MRFIRTIIALALLCPALAWSQPTNMVVFGDSLSDNGNLATLATGTPTGDALLSPPYDNGRVTNGPVAVEVLNDLLNFAPLEAALVSGGGNYAIAGARLRKVNDPIGIPTQVATYLTAMGGTVSDDTLFVLIAGGNDLRDARDATNDRASKIVNRSVNSLMKQLTLLINAGGKYFILGAVPDIGAIPESAALAAALGNQRPVRRGTRLANDFNKSMYYQSRQVAKQFPDVWVRRYDFAQTLGEIEAGAPGNGFAVTDRACYIVIDDVEAYDPACDSGAALDTFVYFDPIHPTAAVHAAAGTDMYDRFQEALTTPGVTSGGSSSSGGDGGSSSSGGDGGSSSSGGDGGSSSSGGDGGSSSSGGDGGSSSSGGDGGSSSSGGDGGSSSSGGDGGSSSGGSSGGASGSITLLTIGSDTDGWILFDDGSRQYAIDGCRAQLESAGLAATPSDWPTISSYPQSEDWSTCPELLTLIGDGSGGSSSGGSSSGGGSGSGGEDEEDKPEEGEGTAGTDGTTVVAN